mmetsp:Transcript_13596/g.26969  ORF Transcript_13596/g.26969 Transcript_13596/m.26969 type:complete len:138 (+) Transcript_13596:430-843(+)
MVKKGKTKQRKETNEERKKNHAEDFWSAQESKPIHGQPLNETDARRTDTDTVNLPNPPTPPQLTAREDTETLPKILPDPTNRQAASTDTPSEAHATKKATKHTSSAQTNKQTPTDTPTRHFGKDTKGLHQIRHSRAL